MSISANMVDHGRIRGRALLGRGGSRVATLDRRAAPHWLILQALPAALRRRFDSTRARDLEAVLELRVRDPQGGPPACFELTVAGGVCTVRPGAARDPGAAVEVGADDIIRLVSGVVGWPDLLSSRRLELSGDPFLALRFPLLFRLPATAGPQ